MLIGREGAVTHDGADAMICVPDAPNPLNRADMEELKATVSTLDPSVNYGIDLYDYILLYHRKLVMQHKSCF